MIKFTTLLFFSFSIFSLSEAATVKNIAPAAMKRMHISVVDVTQSNALVSLGALLFLNNEIFVYIKNNEGFYREKVEAEPAEEVKHSSEHLHQGWAHAPKWKVTFLTSKPPLKMISENVQFIYLQEELQKQ